MFDVLFNSPRGLVSKRDQCWQHTPRDPPRTYTITQPLVLSILACRATDDWPHIVSGPFQTGSNDLAIHWMLTSLTASA